MIRYALASAVLLVTLPVGCGVFGPSDDPIGVDITAYDRSCEAHSDCVAVTACVCNCGAPVEDGAINTTDQSRFTSDRAAVDCVDTVEPDQNSQYQARFAVCVDASCVLSTTEPYPLGETAPPEEWDRTCVASLDCAVVEVNHCATAPQCGAELEAVNRNARTVVDDWNRACEQFVDNENTCSEATAELGAYCSDGICGLVELREQPADADECAEFADAKSCVQAACRAFDFPAYEVEDGACRVTSATVCRPSDESHETTNNPVQNAYHRDGVAMLDTTSWSGWEDCDAATPACACVDGQGVEFPAAIDRISNLQYGAHDGIESCGDAGFRGEISLSNLALSVFVEGQATASRTLTQSEADRLRELVIAIPPKDLQMAHNCDPCRVASLTIEGHQVSRECCGVCNPDFAPAFDAVADFLESFVPE